MSWRTNVVTSLTKAVSDVTKVLPSLVSRGKAADLIFQTLWQL